MKSGVKIFKLKYYKKTHYITIVLYSNKAYVKKIYAIGLQIYNFAYHFLYIYKLKSTAGVTEF